MATGHVQHPGSTARQLMAALRRGSEQWLRADHEFDMVTEWELRRCYCDAGSLSI